MTLKLELRSVPIFQFVASEAMPVLARIAKVVEKSRGDAVLLHAEGVPGIYIVAEGSVGVYPPGAKAALVTIGVGGAFGEMSFLEHGKASATIRVESTPTRLIALQRQDLMDIIVEDPQIGTALYRGIALTLSKKLRATTDKVATELQAGRKLVAALAAEDGSAINIAKLPDEVIKQNELVVGMVEAAGHLADDLARRMPEKAGTISELQMKLVEARAICSTFYPRLARQIRAITTFIQSMEDFIAHSTRD